MKVPAALYATSPRPYKGLPDIEYPFHDPDAIVTNCGRLCIHRKKINISTVLAGQRLGLKEVDDGIWLVSVCDMISDTSISNREHCKQSTPRSARGCCLCLRYRLSPMCPGWTKQEWRPREDSNLRPQDSYHFGFSRHPRAFVVWTVPSPWAMRPLGAAHPVSTPSPDFSGAWLGIGMLKTSEAFPDFEQIDYNL